MEKMFEIGLKLVGAFIVGASLKVWLGGSMSESGAIFQIVLFAIGLTALLISLPKLK